MIPLACVTLFLGAVVIALLLALWAAYAKVTEALKRADRAESEAFRQVDEAESKALIKAGTYLKKEEARMRADAIKKSTAVVKGKVAEHLVPFTEGFNFNPRDARFLGSPIDFLVFEGMTEGDLQNVIFVEVKTGKSRLTKRERQLRDVIEAGNVFHEEVRL